MHLSDFTLETLKERVEDGDSFQIVITPIFPHLFESVQLFASQLETQLESAGFSVLLDDRNQKPKNMFRVAEFLRIPHRVTISGRSIDAGVYEYYEHQTGARCKIPIEDIVSFLREKL